MYRHESTLEEINHTFIGLDSHNRPMTKDSYGVIWRWCLASSCANEVVIINGEAYTCWSTNPL